MLVGIGLTPYLTQMAMPHVSLRRGRPKTNNRTKRISCRSQNCRFKKQLPSPWLALRLRMFPGDGPKWKPL